MSYNKLKLLLNTYRVYIYCYALDVAANNNKFYK